MPLVRYESRNEYSLANPELYRTAEKDAPERLLEGMAMAGLVGIIRQLGDLAEFAAVVFHDLHEEVMATITRGYELLLRIQQVEADLPVIEKSLLSGTNELQYVYSAGEEWHASIRNDQNHLTRGDLPRFIRRSYEECRGPPGLFLLDKFDVAGDGACLKRYSNPSFFKMEWASSELLKAQKDHRDKKSRRVKKKGQHQRNSEIRDDTSASDLPPRLRYSSLSIENFENTASFYQHFNIGHRSRVLDGSYTQKKSSVQDSIRVSSQKAVPAQNEGASELDNQPWNKLTDVPDLKVSRKPYDSKAGSLSENLAESNQNITIVGKDHGKHEVKQMVDAVDDVASDTEQFVDALATMESEVETDSELKANLDIDSDLYLEAREGVESVHLDYSTSEDSDMIDNNVNERVHEHVFDVEKNLTSFQPTTESLEPFENKETVQLLKRSRQAGISSLPLDKDISSDGNSISSSCAEDYASPSLEENGCSPLNNEMKHAAALENFMGLMSGDHVLETSETSEMKSNGHIQFEDLSASFHLLPEPAIPLINIDQSGKSGDLGSLSLHIQGIPTEMSTGLAQGWHILDEPEGPVKAVDEISLHSLAGSTIEPMKLTMEPSALYANSLGGDDDSDIMICDSSSSSSFSCSTLSSPRAVMLPTSKLSIDSEAELKSPFSSRLSSESSSRSPIFSSFHSLMSPDNQDPNAVTLSEQHMETLNPECLLPSSPILNPMAELPELPLLPPLPPLKWRIRSCHKVSLSSTETVEPSRVMDPAPMLVPPPLPTQRLPVLQNPEPTLAPARTAGNDSLSEAIDAPDRISLRKVVDQESSLRPKPIDDREVLLEQIRSRSFSLRHTVIEKHEVRCPIAHINVAAILERANAIRQAFAGSD
eukprot:c27052_g1_i1 orf=239-2878(+)